MSMFMILVLLAMMKVMMTAVKFASKARCRASLVLPDRPDLSSLVP